MGLWVEGMEVDALANSGSQVNTVMPGYVHQHKFPALPLCDLFDHLLNLVGLGGMRTHQFGFVILREQVNEITSYDEDMVFLVVPDESEFSQHVPIVTGTCVLGRIINVIKESKIDRLLTPWAMVRASCLLSQWGTVAEDLGMARDGPTKEGATAADSPKGQDLDEPVFVKETVRLGLFQTQILECRVKPLIGESTYVMVTPLRAGVTQPGGAQPLPPGLHILHAYTRLKMSSGKVSIVVRNMSKSSIFSEEGSVGGKSGFHVACSTHRVVPIGGSHSWGREQMGTPIYGGVTEKLLEKMNLDGLSNWTPQNATWAWYLVLAFHDIFALEGSELGCTSMVEHESHINNSKPFKEWFRHIPPPLLEEVHTSLRDMLDAGVIHPRQSPWCNTVVLVRKKDGT